MIVTGTKKSSFFSCLKNVLYHSKHHIQLFLSLSGHIKKKSRVRPLQSRVLHSSLPTLIKIEGATMMQKTAHLKFDDG